MAHWDLLHIMTDVGILIDAGIVRRLLATRQMRQRPSTRLAPNKHVVRPSFLRTLGGLISHRWKKGRD